jgi:hypothetical protein
MIDTPLQKVLILLVAGRFINRVNESLSSPVQAECTIAKTCVLQVQWDGNE